MMNKITEEKVIKIPCEIYSRVCGFYRPTMQFNPGKKEEYKQRKTFIFKEKT